MHIGEYFFMQDFLWLFLINDDDIEKHQQFYFNKKKKQIYCVYKVIKTHVAFL